MSYLTINGVKQDVCISCLECIKDCPAVLYSRGEGKAIVFADPHHSCIECSHCIAVCPVDAIDFTAQESPIEIPGISRPESLASFEQVSRILLTRRSIRRFKELPVEEDKIGRLMDLLRHAPSASNLQAWEYVLVTDPNTRDRLVQSTLNLFKTVLRLSSLHRLLSPFLGPREKALLSNPNTRERIRRALDDYKNGKDPVLYHAPAILILHSPSYGHMAGNDAGIALTCAMLAAQGLGLGSCWIGFVQEMLFLNGRMRKALDIPEKNSVWGVLAFGYPDVKYHRTAIRNPIKVNRKA